MFGEWSVVGLATRMKRARRLRRAPLPRYAATPWRGRGASGASAGPSVRLRFWWRHPAGRHGGRCSGPRGAVPSRASVAQAKTWKGSMHCSELGQCAATTLAIHGPASALTRLSRAEPIKPNRGTPHFVRTFSSALYITATLHCVSAHCGRFWNELEYPLTGSRSTILKAEGNTRPVA